MSRPGGGSQSFSGVGIFHDKSVFLTDPNFSIATDALAVKSHVITDVKPATPLKDIPSEHMAVKARVAEMTLQGWDATLHPHQ